MATIQQELVIKARADVANAKQGLASLDQSVDGLASAQEGLKTASNDAAQGLAAEAAAATAAAQATEQAAKASGDAAEAARKLGTDAKAAGSGMDKATGEARKLTDQLKEVGDDLDVAAGKMIEGIGGPKAIKALAGAGLALGGLQQVVGAFLDSSEALFKSWGEEGLKVWDVTERGLFKLKGQLAGSVLGTDDMYKAAGRLDTGLTAVNTAAELGADRLKEMWDYSLVKRLFDITGATEAYADMADSAAEKIRRQVQAEKDNATSAAALEKPLGTSREQYESIAETVARLTGKVVDKDKVERESTIARLKDLQTLAIAEERNAQLKAIRDNAELKRAEFTANSTRELMARAQKETNEYISKMDSDDRTLLSGSDKLEMLQSKLAELITTERPAMVEGQMARYRRDAAALMNEMASPLETGTQLLIEGFQTQINLIESEGVKLAATAGENTGASFVGGMVTGMSKKAREQSAKDTEAMIKPIFDKLKEWANSDTIMINYMLARPDAGYLQNISNQLAAPQKTEAELRAERDAGMEAYLDKAEGGPTKRAAEAKAAADAATAQKTKADAAKAAADAAKAESDQQIKNVQETSGAVLDLAGAFATLGGVQDGVIDKMRQVVDVVVKIMEATQALQAVQVAQAATAQATAAVNATASATTAVAATSAGAAAAGAGVAAGSAFVPVLGAVTAVVGLLGSLFGGGSEAPRRDRGGSSKTIYTSAGEAQGAGGDFAYFEGGRQNVTIVTNDAASIRTMQGRLAFVGSRGGSGF
jgi:hypothetical protein